MIDTVKLVRQQLIKEANDSPNLLRDLAGLERYIAESYTNRALSEIIQNADDAGASRVRIIHQRDVLIIANDGRVFSYSDIESLCRSAYSAKDRDIHIGYRGIGFKSVISFSSEIFLFSGDIEVHFSRERTQDVLSVSHNVPLVRIPHFVEDRDSQYFSPIVKELQREGYNTVFVFDKLNGKQVEIEFANFNLTCLLFLNNIRFIGSNQESIPETSVELQKRDGANISVKICSSESTTSWKLIKSQGITLGINYQDGRPHRLSEIEGTVYSFLPTQESTGFGILINGNFSTDPSRRHLIYDDLTSIGVEKASILLSDLIASEAIEDGRGNSESLIEVLAPTIDPKMLLYYKKPFVAQLFEEIKQRSGSKLSSTNSVPKWLNATDFRNICSRFNINVISRKAEGNTAFVSLLRYLGVKEPSFNDFSGCLKEASPSIVGCAEIMAFLINQSLSSQFQLQNFSWEWRIWPIHDKVCSLSEAIELQTELNDTFLRALLEKLRSEKDIKFFISKLTNNEEIADRLLRPISPVTQEATEFKKGVGEAGPGEAGAGEAGNDGHDDGIREEGNPEEQPVFPILRKWRKAEHHAYDILCAKGYQIEDVSKQNLGYDFEGLSPSHTRTYIEVKSIEYSGRPIALTANEMAVAQEKGNLYSLVLIRQEERFVHFSIINNPASILNFTQKCRQWAWETDEYPSAGERYPIG